MSKRTIAIVGATGAQGGGLARAILEDHASPFVVRAIVRDPESAKARALADAGAELVQGDLEDPASIARAFEGAYGAFCVTFFWAHFSPEREDAEAKMMAQAAAEAGLKHVVWSTLEDTRRFVPLDDPSMPTLGGKYKVPHFDAKGAADAYFAEMGVPTTYLLTSFYWDNLIHFGMGPQRGPDGSLMIAFPMDDKPLPGIAAEDIGRCANGVFQDSSLIGQRVGIAGEHLSGAQMAAQLGTALGLPVGFYPITPEAFRALGFPGADDLGNMFQFKRDFNEVFCQARPIERSRALNPRLQSFADWLEANASRIPLPE